MLCNVKCAARKIRITFCGRILCKSVKLTEPPDAEPHVRWCERSAAEAASYSISLIVSLFICASVYDSIREQIGDDTMDLILNAAGQQ